MRPQDIDKVANLVVGSLAGASGAGILGCGAISSAQDYDPSRDCVETPFYYTCETGQYECGGQGNFDCCDGFTCDNDFYCPGEARFACPNDQQFSCPETFQCGGADTFLVTIQFCGLPT